MSVALQAYPAKEVTCDGKSKFDTQGMAVQVAKRRDRSATAKSVYRCEFCGSWHIGMLVKTQRGALKRSGLRRYDSLSRR